MSEWKSGITYGNEWAVEKDGRFAGNGHFGKAVRLVLKKHRSGSPPPAFGATANDAKPFEWPVLELQVAFPREGGEELRKKLQRLVQKLVDQFMSEEHLDVELENEDTDPIVRAQKSSEAVLPLAQYVPPRVDENQYIPSGRAGDYLRDQIFRQRERDGKQCCCQFEYGQISSCPVHGGIR